MTLDIDLFINQVPRSFTFVKFFDGCRHHAPEELLALSVWKAKKGGTCNQSDMDKKIRFLENLFPQFRKPIENENINTDENVEETSSVVNRTFWTVCCWRRETSWIPYTGISSRKIDITLPHTGNGTINKTSSSAISAGTWNSKVCWHHFRDSRHYDKSDRQTKVLAISDALQRVTYSVAWET